MDDTRRYLNLNPEKLKIDKDAFSCVSCSSFLQAVASHLPSASYYIKLAYD